MRFLWVALAAVALIVLFLAWPGAFGLFGPDEPRYASIARHMAQSGDWVSPVLDGKAWLEKPALLYWLGAVGFKLGLGPEAAVRLPLGLLSAAFLVWFGWMVGSWQRAVMLATCAGWIAYSNIAVTDVPLAVFFAAGMFWGGNFGEGFGAGGAGVAVGLVCAGAVAGLVEGGVGFARGGGALVLDGDRAAWVGVH
ncbi:MAG: phospholipid carrier-dependent glycosyltransferase [Acidobacteria bacterium]|nr:phospholipid carrier-dependent glycosyltransferase [Acidobacteriota bacterium]